MKNGLEHGEGECTSVSLMVGRCSKVDLRFRGRGDGRGSEMNLGWDHGGSNGKGGETNGRGDSDRQDH